MTDSQSSRAEIVSFDTEPLILVNGDDEAIGEMSKIDCHRGGGILHRAFSLFIFNAEQKLLVHRRSANKPLWGEYWTNSGVGPVLAPKRFVRRTSMHQQLLFCIEDEQRKSAM